ncbi:MAG: hypothetical protein ACRDUW_19970, partial [Pseudonocardiaceae bacterium]
FKTQVEAKMAIFDWLEGWYNPHRRHSSLGYRAYFAQGRPAFHGKAVHGFRPCRSTARDAGRV